MGGEVTDPCPATTLPRGSSFPRRPWTWERPDPAVWDAPETSSIWACPPGPRRRRFRAVCALGSETALFALASSRRAW
jgi:hypothetical protein